MLVHGLGPTDAYSLAECAEQAVVLLDKAQQWLEPDGPV
jgi:hypothetical protein